MTLTVKNCPTCFVEYAAPQALFDKKQRDGGNWHCPNGHSIVFKETEVDKIRTERDRLKQLLAEKDDAIAAKQRRLDAEREEREHQERRVAAAKGQLTKMKKRAQHGVCPCCSRTFVDLARHMASKHPTFSGENDTADNVVRLTGTKS